MRTVEEQLNITGQPMFHYHPSEVQGFVMEELAKLHPNKEQVNHVNDEGIKDGIRVYTRFSGSEVNTTAIEIVCEYAAQQHNIYDDSRINGILRREFGIRPRKTIEARLDRLVKKGKIRQAEKDGAIQKWDNDKQRNKTTRA